MLPVSYRLLCSLSTLFCCTLAISLVFAIIPLCRHVALLSVAMALAGTAMGLIDTIANLQLVRLYQKDSAIFLQVCVVDPSAEKGTQRRRHCSNALSPGPTFLHGPGGTGQSPGGWPFPGRGQLCFGRQRDDQLVFCVGPAAPRQQPVGSRSATTQHLPVSSTHRRCGRHQGVLRLLDHGSHQCESCGLCVCYWLSGVCGCDNNLPALRLQHSWPSVWYVSVFYVALLVCCHVDPLIKQKRFILSCLLTKSNSFTLLRTWTDLSFFLSTVFHAKIKKITRI